jgi:hypothetical protein
MEDNTYKGVRKIKNNLSGRYSYRVTISVEGERKSFGYYKTSKEAAKARDLYIIKHELPIKTVFLKKIVA